MFPIYYVNNDKIVTDFRSKLNLQPTESINQYAPYIDFIQDEGLFRTYRTVHCKSIYTRSSDFGLEIDPFWRLKHPMVLNDSEGTLLQNFWSLVMNYEQKILKREGHLSYESKIINNSEDLIEDFIPNEDKSNQSKHDIFLLYLSKEFCNKKLLSKMEKGTSALANIMSYKDIYMSRIQNILISGHQLNLMSYLFTVHPCFGF